MTEQVNELYYTLQQDKIIKNEMSSYLKNSEIMYEKISQQNHYHEFAGYLSEKLYKSYLKIISIFLEKAIKTKIMNYF